MHHFTFEKSLKHVWCKFSKLALTKVISPISWINRSSVYIRVFTIISGKIVSTGNWAANTVNHWVRDLMLIQLCQLDTCYWVDRHCSLFHVFISIFQLCRACLMYILVWNVQFDFTVELDVSLKKNKSDDWICCSVLEKFLIKIHAFVYIITAYYLVHLVSLKN